MRSALVGRIAPRATSAALPRPKHRARKRTAMPRGEADLPASRQAAIFGANWQAGSLLKGPSRLLCGPPVLSIEAPVQGSYRRRRGGRAVSPPGSTLRALRVCKARCAFQPCQIAPASDFAEGVGTRNVPGSTTRCAASNKELLRGVTILPMDSSKLV
jgi:hypothetical protein